MSVTADEIARRLAAFRAALTDASIDAALIVEATDLIYLTGVMADAHLVVPAAGEPIFLVRRNLDRATDDGRIVDVRPFGSFKELPALFAELGTLRLGLELDVLPAARYLRYQALLPALELVDVSDALAGVRAVKSEWEIDQSRIAAQQVQAAFTLAPETVATQRTDRDVQIALEHAMRLVGHQGPLRFRGLNGQMFYGAVLAGPDAAVAPWADTPLGGPGPNPAVGKGPGGWELRDGDAISVDLVGGWEGYLADATRTFFRGTPNPLLAEALAVCEAILADLETLMVPGIPAEQLYLRGLELATAAGFGEHWMGHGSSRVKFVGHGIGLEINERPFLAQGFAEPLVAGNVIAVEPKLVFPGVGAVGIENSYVVREGGPERLTTS